MTRARSFAGRWRLTLGYFILVAAIVGVFTMSLTNQARIESDASQEAIEQDQTAARIEYESRRASAENCESINEVKETLLLIVGTLAEPRPDDLPGDARERGRLLEQVRSLIELGDCPPYPVDETVDAEGPPGG